MASCILTAPHSCDFALLLWTEVSRCSLPQFAAHSAAVYEGAGGRQQGQEVHPCFAHFHVILGDKWPGCADFDMTTSDNFQQHTHMALSLVEKCESSL